MSLAVPDAFKYPNTPEVMRYCNSGAFLALYRHTESGYIFLLAKIDVKIRGHSRSPLFGNLLVAWQEF